MTRAPSARSALRVVLLVVVGVVGVLVVVRSGEQLREAAGRLSPTALLLSGVAGLWGLSGGLLSWRAILADLGSPLPPRAAVRVFFPAQLGKYVPGSVWALVAQMELGREHGVPRSRSGAVGLITIGVSLVTGLLLAAATLPFVSGAALERYWWVFLAVPVLGAGLLPAVANPVLDRLLRLARRGPLERSLTGRGLLAACGWALFGWVGFGVHAFLLARDLGASGPALLLVCTGAYALAWTLGFLVVVAPAGAGVREVALVVALAPVLGREQALLLALVSRAVLTVGDVVWAALGVGLTMRTRRQASRTAEGLSPSSPPAAAGPGSAGPGS